MIKKIHPYAFVLIALLPVAISSCKSCNKSNTPDITKSDTTTTSTPAHSINLPHADTSLIPVFSKILDEAFDASAKKDYDKLATYIVYRGINQARFGNDVFNTKHNDEKAVVKITSEVFNKWNAGIDTRDYPRVFDYSQPNTKPMMVLEVIFVSKKKIERKFFGFIKINDDYKIADVTSGM